MKRYVVGFMFNEDMHEVVLVLKNRPADQAGKLNGVGGHIEEGEMPADAMAREFEEEAGWLTTPETWDEFATVSDDETFIVHCFCRRGFVGGVETMTDERVSLYTVDKLAERPMYGNSHALILMARNRLQGNRGLIRAVPAGAEEDQNPMAFAPEKLDQGFLKMINSRLDDIFLETGRKYSYHFGPVSCTGCDLMEENCSHMPICYKRGHHLVFKEIK